MNVPDGFFDLIKRVLTSWQVIAVVAAFFIYGSIVSAAIAPPRPRRAKAPKIKKLKRPPEPAAVSNADTGDIGLDE